MAAVVLGALSGLAGLVAAWLWYQASAVPITPPWQSHERAPVDPVQNTAGWTFASIAALDEGARLNKRAALWTAVSVALAAAQSLLSAFAG